MADNIKDPKMGEGNPNPEGENGTSKEFFLKRWAKAAWRGTKNVYHKVKSSPATHVVCLVVGAGGALVGEELLRRHMNRTEEDEYTEPDYGPTDDEPEIDEPTEEIDE